MLTLNATLLDASAKPTVGSDTASISSDDQTFSNLFNLSQSSELVDLDEEPPLESEVQAEADEPPDQSETDFLSLDPQVEIVAALPEPAQYGRLSQHPMASDNQRSEDQATANTEPAINLGLQEQIVTSQELHGNSRLKSDPKTQRLETSLRADKPLAVSKTGTSEEGQSLLPIPGKTEGTRSETVSFFSSPENRRKHIPGAAQAYSPSTPKDRAIPAEVPELTIRSSRSSASTSLDTFGQEATDAGGPLPSEKRAAEENKTRSNHATGSPSSTSYLSANNSPGNIYTSVPNESTIAKSRTQFNSEATLMLSASEMQLDEAGGHLLPQSSSDGISTRKIVADGSLIRGMAVQIASQASTRTQGQAIEVRLQPEELGRVLISFSLMDDTVSVTVLAERFETSELMRRHIELLTRELSNFGIADVNLAFSKDRYKPNGATKLEPRQSASRDTEVSKHEVRAQNSIGARTGNLDLRV